MYSNPLNSNPSNSLAMCRVVIRKVLETLEYPIGRFEPAEDSFETDCREFRVKIIGRLKDDGYKILWCEEFGLRVL